MASPLRSLDGRVTLNVDGAGTVCEDLASATETGAWVLDGSSGAVRSDVTDAASDGRWFVERLDAYLRSHVQSTTPLPSIVRSAVAQVRREFESLEGGVEIIEQPLSAAAIVQLTEDGLAYLLSADCNLVIQRPSGETETVRGDGPRDLDAAVVRETQRLKREEGLSHDEATARTRQMVVDNRQQLNTSGGYWALSFDGRAVDHARGSILDPSTVDRIALFSDGFERLFELYDGMSYDELFDVIDERGIEAPFERLRELEAGDSDCTDYPRLKQSDDAALAVVDLTTETDSGA